MFHHFGNYGRTLDNRPFGSKITLKHRNTARSTVRILKGSYYLGIKIISILDIFTHSFTGYGNQIEIKKVFLGKFLHNRINTAGFV